MVQTFVSIVEKKYWRFSSSDWPDELAPEFQLKKWWELFLEERLFNHLILWNNLFSLPLLMLFRSTFLSLLIVLSACQSSPQPSNFQSGVPEEGSNPVDSVLVTDDLDRIVTLSLDIKKIVPIAPSMTEILFSAGAGEQIVAVSHADDFPESIKSLPRFNSFPMDYEALVRLKPDVIIGTDQINNPRDAHLFEALGIPVLYFSFESWSDIPRIIRKVGSITSNEVQANVYADSLEQAVNLIRQEVAQNLQRPRVLLLIGSEQLFAFGKDSYVHELIQIAGGLSLTETMDTPSPVLSEEFVIKAEPELIIGTFSDASDLLENHPSFQSVPAIRNNNICMVEASLILRPGPRLVDGVKEMAECIKSVVTPEGDQEQVSRPAS